MKDERLYKQLRELNNKELIEHATLKNVYTEITVQIAEEILEGRTLNEEELAYKMKLEQQHQLSLSIRGEYNNNKIIVWARIINLVLLSGFLSLLVFVPFILMSFSEHNFVSLVIFSVFIIANIIALLHLFFKKPWVFQLLIAVNIPITLICGSMLMIMALYTGGVVFVLTLLCIVSFLIINNRLLLDNRTKVLTGISESRFTIFCVLNFTLGLIILLGILFGFQGYR